MVMVGEVTFTIIGFMIHPTFDKPPRIFLFLFKILTILTKCLISMIELWVLNPVIIEIDDYYFIF